MNSPLSGVIIASWRPFTISDRFGEGPPHPSRTTALLFRSKITVWIRYGTHPTDEKTDESLDWFIDRTPLSHFAKEMERRTSVE